MYSRIVILSFLILSFIINGCYDEELTLRIEGKILDRINNSPISGAHIELWTFIGINKKTNFLTSTNTNNKGHYSLGYTYDNRANCGTYDFALEVSKEGYITKIFSPTSQFYKIKIKCKDNIY